VDNSFRYIFIYRFSYLLTYYYSFLPHYNKKNVSILTDFTYLVPPSCRCGTSQRLILLYKVVEGLVPAIKPEDYLTKGRQRRTIKPKRFVDYVNTNIVENSVKNNTKSFDIIQCNTEQYRNSFFNKTILEWNHLEENIVSATSIESFKSALRHHQ
jgi:hypothetical protein